MAKRKETIKNVKIADNKNVLFGFNYWVSYFIDMCIDLIEFKGLPDTLPAEEISKRLITNGFAIIFKHPVEGIVTCDGYLFDYDFYGRYKKYNVSNPYITFYKNFTPSGKVIGKDGIVIYNNSIEKYVNNLHADNLLYKSICRYARMMADVESTLSSELITQRMPFIPIASNQATYESMKQVFKKLEDGELEIAVDSDFIQDLKILKNKELAVNYLTELIDSRKNILSMFYSEIGIYQVDTKRERLIVDEVEHGKSNEKTLIYSMLKEQERGFNEFNKFFGMNVSVNLTNALYNEDVLITNMLTEV